MSYHIPILTDEITDNLITKKDGVYIDCTVGFGGHSKKLLNNLKTGAKIFGLDLDPCALKEAKKKLRGSYKNITFHNISFLDFPHILREYNIDKVDGFLFDLGISSYQVDSELRGFSYRFNSPLDMRFNQNSSCITAADIVNNFNKKDLETIIRMYGEEKNYRKIASKIVSCRQNKKISTTFDLKKIIYDAVPYSNIKTLSRVFQSLRIETNNEINVIKEALVKTINYLKIGGRIAVISFHSLEDRIAKHFFKDQIIFTSNNKSKKDYSELIKFKVLTKKPILATKSEIRENKRSSSAKLRIAERVE